MANNNAVRLYYFLRDLRYREHLALREQSADMLSVNQYLVQALERERDARRLSRQWAATWKRAAKHWRALAAETHLTTADVLTHDAAIQRGDNCFTEHSRALLRVGVLEGLLRRANAQLRPHLHADDNALLADIDAALVGTVEAGEGSKG